MKSKNYEKELPFGYRQVYHISATDKKVGIVMNLAALGLAAAVVLLAYLPFWGENVRLLLSSGGGYASLVFIVSLLLYLVFHELTHGAVYKAMTGEKLSFGLTINCAYCGVPNIYTYRKTALAALVAPVALFSAVFLALMLWAYVSFPQYYALCSLLFAAHFSGCCGDLYMMYLLLFKFRSPSVLVRDTGPELFLYLPEEKEN